MLRVIVYKLQADRFLSNTALLVPSVHFQAHRKDDLHCIVSNAILHDIKSRASAL
jgi:hypothetical protein